MSQKDQLQTELKPKIKLLIETLTEEDKLRLMEQKRLKKKEVEKEQKND